MDKYLIRDNASQVPPSEAAGMSHGLMRQVAQFLLPLLVELDALVDKRLVRTFVQVVTHILTFRDRANGLLLGELGGYLLSPEHAPAGTKRLSNLLHCDKWSASLICQFLWRRATQQVEQWHESRHDGLVLWDESCWEKPESLQLEDLGPTRSSKAKRLTHLKPGYSTPPGRPIFVPGMQWLAVVLIGRSTEQGPPQLAAQRWWTTRGAHASYKRDEEGKLLVELAATWGQQVIHLFDQGFASAFWVGLLLAFCLRFVLRFREDYQLVDEQGNRRLTWKIAQGKRGWSERRVWDARRARWVQATVLALHVSHPALPDCPLTLVVCPGKDRAPWYLLTTESVRTDEQAWRVVVAYVRRWNIELTWKYEKRELAFQSPRVYQGEAREKTALVGKAGLRVLTHAAGCRLSAVAAVATAVLRSSNGSALSSGETPAHALAQCSESLVARASP